MLDTGGIFEDTAKGFIYGPLATFDQAVTYSGRFVRFQTIALRDGSSGSAISAPGVEAFGILRGNCLGFEQSSGYLSEIQQVPMRGAAQEGTSGGGGNMLPTEGSRPGHIVNVTRDSITLDFLDALEFHGWFLGLLSLCLLSVFLSLSLSP